MNLELRQNQGPGAVDPELATPLCGTRWPSPGGSQRIMKSAAGFKWWSAPIRRRMKNFRIGHILVWDSYEQKCL